MKQTKTQKKTIYYISRDFVILAKFHNRNKFLNDSTQHFQSPFINTIDPTEYSSDVVIG